MNVPRQLAVFNIFCFQTFPKQQKRPTLTSLILCVNKYIFKLRRIYNIFRITKGSFNARSSLVPRLRTAVLGDGMGVGRIFSRGGDSRGFSQNFSRGSQNNGEFVFYSSKLKKQPFFAKHFKIQEGTLAPPAPLPTPLGVGFIVTQQFVSTCEAVTHRVSFKRCTSYFCLSFLPIRSNSVSCMLRVLNASNAGCSFVAKSIYSYL